MLTTLALAAACFSGGILVLFSLRRLGFTWAALTHRQFPGILLKSPVDILVLVPARDEAAGLPKLLHCLEELDYPSRHLKFILLDDGSRDGTLSILEDWASGQANRRVHTIPVSVGKAGALNQGIEVESFGELIAVFDADECPQADSLSLLAAAMQEPGIAAAGGFRRISNAAESLSASYAAFEALVHQRITQAAKDRLNLGPAILGSNCIYRRDALAQAGGFRRGMLLEDSDMTIRLINRGWQTRFEPAAVSSHRAAASLTAYWKQHLRWSAGFLQVASANRRAQPASSQARMAARIEQFFFAAGYLDRAAWAGTLALAILVPPLRPLFWLLGLSLLIPLIQIAAALHLEGRPSNLWKRIFVVPLFYGVDLAAALAGAGRVLLGKPVRWERRIK